jgi:hypothetical protein
MRTPGRTAPDLAGAEPGGSTAAFGGRLSLPLIDAAPRVATPSRSAGWLSIRYRPYVLGTGSGILALVAGALVSSRPKDAVALLLGAAVIAAVLVRPFVGALLLAVVVPMTSGLASGFPVPHVRLSEALIGVVGLTLIVGAQRRDAVAWQTLDWVLLAYGLCWAFFGVLADVSLRQHLTIDEWGTVLGQLQFFLVYRGVRIAVRDARQRRLAVAAAVIGTVPVALLAMIQEVRAPGVAALISKITGGLTGGSVGGTATGSLLRATGPFNNWAALAGYLLPVVLVVVVLALARSQVPARRWFVGAGVLAAIALALTIEQSAIACAIVGVAVLVRRYDQGGRLTRWVLAGVAVAILAASPLLVSRLVHELAASPGTGRIAWVPQTVSFRWSVWTKQYLPAIGARPLTGYGVALPPSISWPYPESQYVSFLVEGGVPMLLMFAALVWAMFGGTLAAARSTDRAERALGLALTTGIVAMLVLNLFWPFLSNGGMPQILWALMALTVPRVARQPESVAVGWSPSSIGAGT